MSNRETKDVDLFYVGGTIIASSIFLLLVALVFRNHFFFTIALYSFTFGIGVLVGVIIPRVWRWILKLPIFVSNKPTSRF